MIYLINKLTTAEQDKVRRERQIEIAGKRKKTGRVWSCQPDADGADECDMLIKILTHGDCINKEYGLTSKVRASYQ